LRPGACPHFSGASRVRYSNEAVEQLKKSRVFDRTAVLDQIEQILSVNPTVVSKARVKRLREPAPTQYCLRVGEFRVFYDVEEEFVLIIQILGKQDSTDYLGGSS
jgi:mRNA-degrading endonuclease RelE of RelBE toxin-antitoxin system